MWNLIYHHARSGSFSGKYSYGNKTDPGNNFSAAELLDHLPAADVVEVVRCRDCMYCDTMNWSGQTAFECEHPLGLIDASPNNYCVFGERK